MTPHIAAKKEEIASIVLMPGDPKRAEYIAKKYLQDLRLVSDVRNIYAFTGTYHGKSVTVMASGMGNASIGIYAYELMKFYDVDSIIRIGTAGSYVKDLEVRDLLLVNECYSDSTYALVQSGSNDHVMQPSFTLNFYLQQAAEELGKHVTIGNIYSTDVFYKMTSDYQEEVQNHHCLACEMESFALFHTAKQLGKKAACLLTISDSLVTNVELSSDEREKSLDDMIEVALETLIKL